MKLLSRESKQQQAAAAPDLLEDDERERAEIDGRHADAEAEVSLCREALEEERTDVEQKRTDLVAQLALGRIDEPVFEGREAELDRRLAEAEKALARAEAVVAALGAKGAELVVRIGDEKCARREAVIEAMAEAEAETERLLARQRREREEAEEELAAFREETRWAKAPYDPAVAEQQRQSETRLLETVKSIARHPRWRWDEEAPSGRLREMVERERAKMDAEEERYRAQQAELARESWMTAGRQQVEQTEREREAEAAGRPR